MWSLVKADLIYTRIGLGVVSLFVALFFVLSAFVGDWNFHLFVNNSAVSAMIGMGIMGASIDKERRDRLMMGLPVTVADVGAARLLYVLVVFAALWVVWAVFLLFRPQGGSLSDLWVMINASSVSFVLFALFMIHHDLGFYKPRRYRWIVYVAAFVFVGSIAWMNVRGVENDWGPAYGRFFRTFPAVVLHVTLAALLFILDLRVFTRRRSYLS